MMPDPSQPTTSPVALVTGASSGIGEAAARRFARAGYTVVLAARRLERLQSLAAEITALGSQALPLETDVSRLEDIQRLVASTIDTYSRIDVLVNNAGFGRLSWLETLDPVKDVQAQLEVNLLGLIWTAQAVLPHMIARRRGHILNVGSMAGYVAPPTYSIYAASKFGVRGFTDALRREARVHGIRVSGVYPGPVATEFSRHTGTDRKTGLHTPAWLALSSEDVAEAIYRLVLHPRRQIVQPWIMHFAIAIDRLFPGLVDAAVQRLFVRRERS
jgi:short-subunit dehydrogenase